MNSVVQAEPEIVIDDFVVDSDFDYFDDSMILLDIANDNEIPSYT